MVAAVYTDASRAATGIVVDRVQEVLDIEESQIEDSPQFGSSVDTDFIMGMGKIGDDVKILLDIDKVLGGDDLSGLVSNKKDTIPL